MQILSPLWITPLKVTLSVHTHAKMADTLQMVSSLVAGQHTYAGYNSAKSSLHWDLAGHWRSAAKWQAFRGKTPTTTHNPATDGASAKRKQGWVWPPILCLFADIRKRQSEVMDNYNEPFWEYLFLRATEASCIVGCQCVLSDMMVARSLCADIRMSQSAVKNNYSEPCWECIHPRATRAPSNCQLLRCFKWYDFRRLAFKFSFS